MDIKEFKELKVGDKVTIRAWDDMAKEYGFDGGGAIKTPIGFIKEMKKYCGKTMPVTYIVKDKYLRDGVFLDGCLYLFHYSMFESAHKAKYATIVEHSIKGDETIVKLSDGRVGVAKCTNAKKFDVLEGLRLAAARAYSIKEAKRQAKVGEYVKVVRNLDFFVDGYKEGDIYKVERVVSGVGVTCNNGRIRLINAEYVVLENYTPEK